MLILYITLALTFILSLVARIINDENDKPAIFMTVCVMGVLILVSGLRNNIGDTSAYTYLYKIVGNGVIVKGAYETGFIVFITLLNQISQDPQLLIFSTAFITNGLHTWVLRKYSSLFELETYLYITSGYYVATMNGIRQALAAAVMFAATRFVIEGKFIKYLLVTLIMYSFHTSALIMIPVYFIARQNAWSKKIMLMILVLPILFIFFQPLMSGVFTVMEGSRYESYKGVIMTGGEGGASGVRAIIAAIPVVMAYFGRHKLKAVWAESNIFVNMSLINLIIMMFSMFNWVFSRFQFYFLPYNFILLPYMVRTLFSKSEKQIIYFLVLGFYFVLFYYEHVVTLGINYKSNFF